LQENGLEIEVTEKNDYGGAVSFGDKPSKSVEASLRPVISNPLCHATILFVATMCVSVVNVKYPRGVYLY